MDNQQYEEALLALGEFVQAHPEEGRQLVAALTGRVEAIHRAERADAKLEGLLGHIEAEGVVGGLH